jgi:signal transduction histidine kinase
MLDLAEAEASRLMLARVPVRPTELLQQAVIGLQAFAQKEGVRLTISTSVIGTRQMDGDAVRLRQAFTNLIHNALKFTPAGGEVCVSDSAEHDRLAIEIADHGVGMPPELLASVVRPFHRLRSALDGQHQGAGLGLPFAKAVIELHGGKLDLTSEIGAGTTASIELPVQTVAVSRAA